LDREILYRIDDIKNQLIEYTQYQYARVGWGEICVSDFGGFHQVLKREILNNPYHCIQKRSIFKFYN